MDLTKKLRSKIGKCTNSLSDPLDGAKPACLKKVYYRFGETYGTFQNPKRKIRKFDVRIGIGDIDAIVWK